MLDLTDKANGSAGLVGEANLTFDGTTLTNAGNTGGLTWATVNSTPEGTAILSTGESGGAKYLREDGDGTCSWQSVPAGVGGASGVDFNDSVKARWGTDNDLRVYHDNTHGYVENLKNNLYVHATNYLVIGSTDTNGSNTEVSAKFLRNGNNEFYYDNVKKLETTATGATVTGATQATGYESPASVSANWSIGANNNAMFPGPMTVASGVTVTVPANRTLTIV